MLNPSLFDESQFQASRISSFPLAIGISKCSPGPQVAGPYKVQSFSALTPTSFSLFPLTRTVQIPINRPPEHPEAT